MAEENQDGQKTIVAFIVGLLIGGMLVWAFSGPEADAPTPDTDNESEMTETNDDDNDSDTESTNDNETESETNNNQSSELEQTLEIGDGEIEVNNQPADTSVELESAVYPISEGWIGVREYDNENLGYILGVVRFSEEQGIVPDSIRLQRSTTAGRDYAVVIFTDDGDRSFNLGTDVQIDEVFGTFTAQ